MGWDRCVLVVGCVRRGEEGQSNDRTVWCASWHGRSHGRLHMLRSFLEYCNIDALFHIPTRRALIEMDPSIIT